MLKYWKRENKIRNECFLNQSRQKKIKKNPYSWRKQRIKINCAKKINLTDVKLYKIKDIDILGVLEAL